MLLWEFAPVSTNCIALLGRKDEPTDALEEYSRYLGSALKVYDIHLEITRVSWETCGWLKALHDLRLQAGRWNGNFVLIQCFGLVFARSSLESPACLENP